MIRTCNACAFQGKSPRQLGEHYREHPSHRPAAKPRAAIAPIILEEPEDLGLLEEPEDLEPRPIPQPDEPSILLIHLDGFEGPKKPRPGVEYIYVPAQHLPEYQAKGFALTTESHTESGVTFLLMEKGEALFGIMPQQVEPSVKVYLPRGMEAAP